MSTTVYRYRFHDSMKLDVAEESLALAILGSEALHGSSRTRLEAGHAWKPSTRTCVIDGSTQVGRNLNKLFAYYLMREFGEDSFEVERLQDPLKDFPDPLDGGQGGLQ